MEVIDLRVTVVDSGDHTITAGAEVTVGDVVDRLGGSKGQVLSVQRTSQALHRNMLLVDVDLRSGDVIELRSRSSLADMVGGLAPATLRVVAGPATGTAFELTYGTTTVGRVAANDITIVDTGMSRQHATITITRSKVSITDNLSTNGVLINGERATEPAELSSGDQLMMGETVIIIEHRIGHGATVTGDVGSSRNTHSFMLAEPDADADGDDEVEPKRPEFHRRARSLDRYEGSTCELPAPPAKPGRWSLSRSMMEQHELARTAFQSKLKSLSAELAEAQIVEQARRQYEDPSVDEVDRIVAANGPRLWERTPGDFDHLVVRVGRGTVPSRHRIIAPADDDGTDPNIESFIRTFEHLDGLPVTVHLKNGVRLLGPHEPVTDLASSILSQLAGLHSPSDLLIGAMVGAETEAEWQWLKWLPHSRQGIDHLGADLLAATADRTARLCEALTAEIGSRSRRAANRPGNRPTWPSIVVLVEEQSSASAAALTDLITLGPDCDIHLLWVAVGAPRLPEPLGTTVTIVGSDAVQTDGEGAACQATVVAGDESIERVTLEGCDERQRMRLARNLAPIIDRSGRSTSGPGLGPFLFSQLYGDEPSPQRIVDRWSKPSTGLRAAIGKTNHGSLDVDLDADGPQALVVGERGSGKTSLLEAWVASLAATHAPSDLSCYLVASPAERSTEASAQLLSACGSLPHVTGSLADPADASGLLAALGREVARRTELLSLGGIDSMAAMRARGRSDCPARLLIVVDDLLEWADLDRDFASGVIDLAGRAQHLGVYLIASVGAERYPFFDLSPASVQKIRSLTGIKIALRIDDPALATTIAGVDGPSDIDRASPGRGWIKSGSADAVLFQSALVRPAMPGEQALAVEPFELGRGLEPAPLTSHVDDGTAGTPSPLFEAVAKANALFTSASRG